MSPLGEERDLTNSWPSTTDQACLWSLLFQSSEVESRPRDLVPLCLRASPGHATHTLWAPRPLEGAVTTELLCTLTVSLVSFLRRAKTKNTLALPYILEEDSSTQKSRGSEPHPQGRGKPGKTLLCVYEIHKQLLPLPNPQQWPPGPALTPPRAPSFSIC